MTTDQIIRCFGDTNDPLMTRYHDEEWGVPLHDDRGLFEFLVLDSFQAGLSWRTILHKREAFRNPFINLSLSANDFLFGVLSALSTALHPAVL